MVSSAASVSADEKPPEIACTLSSWAKRVMQAIALSGLASESQKTISTFGPSPLALISSAASSAPSRTSSPCGICSGPKTPILKVSVDSAAPRSRRCWGRPSPSCRSRRRPPRRSSPGRAGDRPTFCFACALPHPPRSGRGDLVHAANRMQRRRHRGQAQRVRTVAQGGCTTTQRGPWARTRTVRPSSWFGLVPRSGRRPAGQRTCSRDGLSCSTTPSPHSTTVTPSSSERPGRGPRGRARPPPRAGGTRRRAPGAAARGARAPARRSGW
jgi:hypothetical protein